jgi:hypothetical protein
MHMRRRWSKVVWVCAAVTLASGSVSYLLLSPEAREAIDHYGCLKREEANVATVARLIDTALKEGPSHETRRALFAGRRKYNVSAKPRALAWLIQPILNRSFRWHARQRVCALRDYIAAQQSVAADGAENAKSAEK